MNGINQRLFDNLFVKKEVSCFVDSYRDLYYQIWPCEDMFIKFIKSNDSSVKMDTAKKIYFYIQMYDNFFLPSDYINNTIDYQEKFKVDDTLGYIPQDHVIHSINTYILGIYLFFNSTIFSNKLLDQILDTHSHKEKVLIFVKNWRCFAFYHDVGYYWETNVKIKQNDDTQESNKLGESLEDHYFWYNSLYFYVIRNVARLIVNVSFLRNGNKKFCLETVINNSVESKWLNNDKIIDSDTIKKVLSEFETATLICDSDTLDGISQSYPIIEDNKYLCVVLDETNVPLAFLIKKSNIIIDYICKENFHLDIFNSRLPKGISCQFFINDFKGKLLSYTPRYQHATIENFFNNLPDRYKNQIDFYDKHTYEIDSFYNGICEWLLTNTKERDLSNTSIDLIKSKYAKEAFVDVLKNTLIDYCKKCDDKSLLKEQLPDTIKKYTREITKLSSKLSDEIYNTQNRIYQRENGVSHDILFYSQCLYKNLLAFFGLSCKNENTSINVKNYSFIATDVEKGIVNLFNHDPSNEFAKNLYNKIIELCNDLQISSEKLFNYSPEHSLFDHGIVSSGLLYQFAILNNSLLKFYYKDESISLSWYNLPNINFFDSKECIDQYGNIIFAVLLHNIKTRESDSLRGVKYKQNIRINPFAFYGALCDLLQLWGRPKQVNLSKSYLPEHHFLDTNFDIVVTDNKIKLLCSRSDLEYVQKKIDEGKTYLPGIEAIIEIHSID